MLFVLVGMGYAQEMTILPVNPVPGVDEMEEGGSEALRQTFDDAGTIDRMGEGEIVLDDSLFRLAPAVRFYSERGIPITKSSFKPGMMVGCKLNAQGEIASLWIIKE